jgi:Protein of unknown function (DUF3500)
MSWPLLMMDCHRADRSWSMLPWTTGSGLTINPGAVRFEELPCDPSWYSFRPGSHREVGLTRGSPTARLMADLAAQVLTALDDDHRRIASLPFPDDEEPRRFYWIPTDHGGLSLRSCDDRARALIMQLVASGLSPAGFNTASTIISLQHILSRAEGWHAIEDGRQRRDPLEYQLSIFGAPLMI